MAESSGQFVERKVQFYRLRETSGETGEAVESDPRGLCELITSLPWTEGARYYDTPEGDRLCVWPHTTSEQVRLSIGRIRRRDLPMIEDLGTLSPLVIGDSQGLAEQTHIVFFPDGIIGTEFNFYGPRVGSFILYVANKFLDRPPLFADMLLNRDALSRLDALGRLRLIKFRLRKDYLSLLGEAEHDVYHALDATLTDLQGESVELVLRTAPRSRRWLGNEAFNMVRRLAGGSGIKEGADIFRVQGQNEATNRIEWVDLLRDQLVSIRKVARGSSVYRSVDDESMYQEINEAYDSLRPEILSAASLEEIDD